MDVLRTAASVMGCLEPETENRTVDVIERLIGVFTSSLMYWHNAVRGAQQPCRCSLLFLGRGAQPGLL